MVLPDTASLIAVIRALLHSARQGAARQVNTPVVVTNYEVGGRIVEHEEGGEQRADRGRAVVTSLSKAFTAELGRGFSAENLWLIASPGVLRAGPRTPRNSSRT
jgi:hypothetical protein